MKSSSQQPNKKSKTQSSKVTILQEQCLYTSKIEYQQQEIQQLKEQKLDLQKLLALNKQIIRTQQ